MYGVFYYKDKTAHGRFIFMRKTDKMMILYQDRPREYDDTNTIPSDLRAKFCMWIFNVSFVHVWTNIWEQTVDMPIAWDIMAPMGYYCNDMIAVAESRYDIWYGQFK